MKRLPCREECVSGSFANRGGIMGINSQRPKGKETRGGGRLFCPNNALGVASKIDQLPSGLLSQRGLLHSLLQCES